MGSATFHHSGKHHTRVRKLNAPALLGLGLLGITPLIFYGSLMLLIFGD